MQLVNTFRRYGHQYCVPFNLWCITYTVPLKFQLSEILIQSKFYNRRIPGAGGTLKQKDISHKTIYYRYDIQRENVTASAYLIWLGRRLWNLYHLLIRRYETWQRHQDRWFLAEERSHWTRNIDQSHDPYRADRPLSTYTWNTLIDNKAAV